MNTDLFGDELNRLAHLSDFEVVISEGNRRFAYDTLYMHDDNNKHLEAFVSQENRVLVSVSATPLALNRDAARLIGLALLHFAETGELPGV